MLFFIYGNIRYCELHNFLLFCLPSDPEILVTISGDLSKAKADFYENQKKRRENDDDADDDAMIDVDEDEEKRQSVLSIYFIFKNRDRLRKKSFLAPSLSF